MSNPFAGLSSEELLQRKDELVLALARRLADTGIRPDYAVSVMAEARAKGLPDGEYRAILEALVEIEAMKYTLAARRIRAFESGEQ